MIYVAGGWFNPRQLEELIKLENLAISIDKTAFCPRLMNLGQDGCDWNYIFQENIKHLDECTSVLASTVDKDMGTIWECGYAYSKGKQIIYYTPGIDKPNLMLGMSGVVCKTISEIKDYIAFGIKPIVGDYE